jgi:hypothetical protein
VTFRGTAGIGITSLLLFLVAFSGSGELILADDALVTVHLAFYSVLQNAFRGWQQPNDLEGAPARRLLVPIGRETDGLSDRKFVCRHVRIPTSQPGARRGAVNALGQPLVFESDLAQMLLDRSRGRFVGQPPNPSGVTAIVLGRKRRVRSAGVHPGILQGHQ